MSVERTHLATTSTQIALREVSVEAEKGKGCYKPAGFWYEVDGDWRRWCEGEDFQREGFIHNVSLNDCNVLFIDSLRALDKFHAEYHHAERDITPTYRRMEIDWPRVAALYDGIEIAPYQWKRRMAHDFMWYYGWDCASGVIWRPKNATVAYVGEWQPTMSKQEIFGQSDPVAPHQEQCILDEKDLETL